MDQTEKFNVLGEKPVGKLLMQYAIPAIVAMTASSIYNIIDGIFIGQGVGKEAIMGLALTAPVMSPSTPLISSPKPVPTPAAILPPISANTVEGE